MRYKYKKYVAIFLAVFTMMFSIFSSYVIVSAENQFWSFAIGGVEFLKELIGLPADLVTDAINKGIDLGNKYNDAMKDGVDYGGATYNKTENKFYLKKDVNNNVYINPNLYNVVYSVASDVIDKLNGYYLFTPSHSWDEFLSDTIDIERNYLLNRYNGSSSNYLNSDDFDKDYANFSRSFLFAIYPVKTSKDSVVSRYPAFYKDNISGFSSQYYLAYDSDSSSISAYVLSGDSVNTYVVSYFYPGLGSNSHLQPYIYDKSSTFKSLGNIFRYSSDNMYGSPFRVFYSLQDLKNFLNNGKHFIPKITINTTLKIPSDLFDNGKLSQQITNIYNNIDKSNKNENEIQDSFNTEVNNYFNDFSDGNDTPVSPTPTPPTGGSGEGGGDDGNITPTPAPDFTDGLKDTNDYLKQILEKVTSILQVDTEFSKSFETVSQNLCKYLESNNEKLDQIITAINALSNGKTEDEVNGCKYDFTQLSQSLTSLWNDSDQKFDQMIKLLEENNKYQEKIIGDLNDIKAILIAQTVLDAFQNRSKETADKAKEKFPTSIPWDIAMIVNTFSAEPQPIKFELPIKVNSLNINETITVDLSTGEWEKLGKLCRYMLSVLFILFLIQLSRKLFSNGGDE